MTHAVLIAGQLRFWSKAAPGIFSYFNRLLGEKPDYFFATWDTTRDFWWPEEASISTERTINIQEEIINVFKKYNETLVNYTVMPMIPDISQAYYYQAHLAEWCNTLKQKEEINRSRLYDQVIEIRPDLFLRPIDNSKFVLAKPNEVVCSGGWYSDKGIKLMGDFYIRSDSTTNNIVSRRKNFNVSHENINGFFPALKYASHYILSRWLDVNNLKVTVTDEGVSTVIRSNFPNDLLSWSFEQATEYSNQWYAWQATQREKLTKK